MTEKKDTTKTNNKQDYKQQKETRDNTEREKYKTTATKVNKREGENMIGKNRLCEQVTKRFRQDKET